MSERIEKLDDLEQPVVELTEDAAQEVRGGVISSLSTSQMTQLDGTVSITQDTTVNKAKTADKAFNAMDAYIRG